MFGHKQYLAWSRDFSCPMTSPPLGSIWALGHRLVFDDGLGYLKVTYLIVVAFLEVK
jgi:hypothetical protein